jgi:mRNA interferase RelE/StbE
MERVGLQEITSEMMWNIKYHPQSLKSLKKLDQTSQERIFNYLNKIADTADVKAFGKVLSNKLKGFWRYKIGDYRVICEIKQDELVIVIIDIGRKNIYKTK